MMASQSTINCPAPVLCSTSKVDKICTDREIQADPQPSSLLSRNKESASRSAAFRHRQNSVPSLASSISSSISTSATTIYSKNKTSSNSSASTSSTEIKDGPTDFAASIKRSFAILSTVDLSLNTNGKRGRFQDYHPCYFHCAGSQYAKEWTQKEKDSLIAFVNKYIIKGELNKGGPSDDEKKDDSAKKRRTD